jgi:hypothetical protein
MAYLLGRGLRDLQILGHALAGHVARPPWRRGQASFQASWLILNERYVRQSKAAEPRPQLEALLEHLLIIVLLGRVFDDNCVISFANLALLLGLGLPFLWDLDKLRRRASSETNFAKSSCKKHNTSIRLLLRNGYSTRDAANNLILWARGGVLGHRARRVRRHVFEDSTQPIHDVVVVDFITGHPRRVVVTGVLVP